MGGGHKEGNGEEFLPEATEKVDVKTIEQVVCKEEVDDKCEQRMWITLQLVSTPLGF